MEEHDGKIVVSPMSESLELQRYRGATTLMALAASNVAQAVKPERPPGVSREFVSPILIGRIIFVQNIYFRSLHSFAGEDSEMCAVFHRSQLQCETAERALMRSMELGSRSCGRRKFLRQKVSFIVCLWFKRLLILFVPFGFKVQEWFIARSRRRGASRI